MPADGRRTATAEPHADPRSTGLVHAGRGERPPAQRGVPHRRAGADPPQPPSPSRRPAQPFNTEQLDALVASIALYPDDLLTQLLMASTFPLEVVAAARWVEDPAHKSLSGDALVKALEAEPWDPSVKSLVPFPVVLATLNSNLTWLQQLGYAFATQQADVFAAVQRLRRLAQANDKLQSSPQQVVSTQQVTVEPAAGSSQPPTQQEVIVIQPAQPDTVYVPSYNPSSGVRLVVALPVISAVLRGAAAGLLFRHRAGHRAGICGRRRGRGRAMGLGSTSWGGAAATRTSTSTDTTTSTPTGRRSTSNRWGGGAAEWAARQFRPRARRTGGPSRPLATSPFRAVPCDPPTRPVVGGAGGRRCRWSAASVASVGRAVAGRRVDGPVEPGGVGRRRAVPVGAGRCRWSAGGVRAGRAVPAAGRCGGPGGVGRPGGPGGVGGRGRSGRSVGVGGRWLVAGSAQAARAARRPAQRPAGGGQRLRRCATSGRIRRYEQRSPGRTIQPTRRTEPIVRDSSDRPAAARVAAAASAVAAGAAAAVAAAVAAEAAVADVAAARR